MKVHQLFTFIYNVFTHDLLLNKSKLFLYNTGTDLKICEIIPGFYTPWYMKWNRISYPGSGETKAEAVKV